VADSKIRHSNDKYRNMVWQCNTKYAGNKGCRARCLRDEEIEAAFLATYNQRLDNRDVIFAAHEEALRVLSDTSALDTEATALTEECERGRGLCAGLPQRMTYGVCDKKKQKCSVCPSRSFASFNWDVVYNHLSGKKADFTDVAGIYPLTADECCYFLAIDFDGDAWLSDITAFRATCKEYGLVPAVERSRGGNGGYVLFFFEDKIPAATARKFGSALLTQIMARRHEIKFKSYDRLFPNQDIMPKGGAT